MVRVRRQSRKWQKYSVYEVYMKCMKTEKDQTVNSTFAKGSPIVKFSVFHWIPKFSCCEHYLINSSTVYMQILFLLLILSFVMFYGCIDVFKILHIPSTRSHPYAERVSTTLPDSKMWHQQWLENIFQAKIALKISAKTW